MHVWIKSYNFGKYCTQIQTINEKITTLNMNKYTFNMKKTILTILCLIGALSINAQEPDEVIADEASTDTTEMPDEDVPMDPIYKYRVYLSDKKGSPYSISRPEEFLSARSIERRRKQGLSIDETDIPVNRSYLDKVEKCGVKLIHSSKWNNTVLVETSDTLLMENVLKLSCVDSIRLAATYTSLPTIDNSRFDEVENKDQVPESKEFFAGIHDDLIERHLKTAYKYGNAYNQIKMLNGIALHERGYRGQGMQIAVIDGGFKNVDIIPYFKNVKILGTRDFALIGGTVYEEEDHGTMVLSTMAGNCRGRIIGTAPEASYWLLRSEDGHSEQLVEEDNWCAAIEFADSVGVDVVNTSLGYTDYDNDVDDVKYWELDGKTRMISRSASMAASKGLLLCLSAGNEASYSRWKLISPPADASDVLTVGALTPEGENTYFSSLGNSSDGRIKPDICAQGEDCCVVGSNGELRTADGTSFASPITCGMVACYWQAHPEMTVKDVIEQLHKNGSYASHPNNVYGWGIPDYSK